MRIPGQRITSSLTAAACVALGWAAALCAEPAEETAAPPRELTERQAEAEAARDLAFKKPVVYKPLTRADIVPLIRDELQEQFAEGELDNLLLAYEKLGLIKSADGLAERLVHAYAREVMALYDQKTHTVHLVEDLPVPAAMQKIAEVHELVHALQDQHFDLSALPLDDVHDGDRASAAMALVEGDATLATVEYAAVHARLSLGDSLRVIGFAAEPGPAVPYLFRRTMSFTYFDGLRLAEALHKRGGWTALNKAFADPPTSTEQVLHFQDKYLDARDEPTPVELPDCAPAVGEDWKLVAHDVLGELFTQVLFRQHLSFVRAGKPSRGWDGDRLHFYRSGEGAGENWALVWATVWDTDKDASEFARAYRTVLVRKYEPAEPGAGQHALGLLVTGETGAALLHVKAQHAVSVEASTAAIAQALMRHVLAADTNHEEPTTKQ